MPCGCGNPEIVVTNKENGSDNLVGKVTTPCCHWCGVEYLLKDA